MSDFFSNSIKEFDLIPVTTMSLFIFFDGKIDLSIAFHLLSITWIKKAPMKVKNFKKYYPGPEMTGSVLGCKYDNMCRGISDGNTFKHAMFVTTVNKYKNNTISLNSDKGRIIGITTFEEGKETIEDLLNCIKEIQEQIDFYSSDTLRSERTIEWVKDNTKGFGTKYVGSVISDDPEINPHYLGWVHEDFDLNNEGLTRAPWSDPQGINLNYQENRCLKPDVQLKKCLEKYEDSNFDNITIIPETSLYSNLDSELYNIDLIEYVLTMIPNYRSHSYYCGLLDWIILPKKLYSGKLEFQMVKSIMINNHYNVGFSINRRKLDQYIKNHPEHDLISSCQNNKDKEVTIKLAYDIPDELKPYITTDSNKKNFVKFKIYRSGKITQSGPSIEINRVAYYKLMELMVDIRPLIRRKSSYKIKYYSGDEIKLIIKKNASNIKYIINRSKFENLDKFYFNDSGSHVRMKDSDIIDCDSESSEDISETPLIDDFFSIPVIPDLSKINTNTNTNTIRLPMLDV